MTKSLIVKGGGGTDTHPGPGHQVAAGPKDNWAENKPGATDLPTNSSKAKRFKKSKKLAANHEQKADND